MDTTLLVVAGCLLVVPGILLWWPARHDPSSRSDLGAALLTGAVVSFAVFALQLVFDARLRDLEDRQRAAQEARDERLRLQGERASLQLTIGLQPNLTGIDLQDRDLRAFYLSRKRLRDAVLNRADLREANLSLADLRGAELNEARLQGANLDGADLTSARLGVANLRDASLVGATLANADLSGATLAGADFSGADLSTTSFGDASLEGVKYDARTKWPEFAQQRRCAAEQTCTARSP